MIAQGAAATTAWTASSRLFFALARDRAFPGPTVFMAKNRADVPWVAVLSAAAISVLLA
jgi:amino acid transporter